MNKLAIVLLSSLVVIVAGNYGGYYAPTTTYEAPLLKVLKAEKPFIPIVRLIENMDGYGNYNVDAESADGTKQSESGSSNGDGGAVKSGSYSWTSPEGIFFSVSYTADENGFHPVASHLPTPPPMPVEIAKSLSALPVEEKLVSSYSSYNYESPMPAAPLPPKQPMEMGMMMMDKKPMKKPMIDIQHGMLMSKPCCGAELTPSSFLVSPPAPPPSAFVVPILTPAGPLPVAPIKTHVETSEFFIDSDMAKTVVKIGH